MKPLSRVLHVAHHSDAQHATNAQNRATAPCNTCATTSLKALANAVLQRNAARNTDATAPLKTVQQQPLGRVASTAETQSELRTLVEAVATFNGLTEDQTAEAHHIAQADAVAALECFRILAARDGLLIH